MANTSMLHVRVDSALKEEAAEKLADFGLTVSDAVRILLTRITKEGGLPAGLTTDSDAHDAWFRNKVKESIANYRSEEAIDHQQLMDEVQMMIDAKSQE